MEKDQMFPILIDEDISYDFFKKEEADVVKNDIFLEYFQESLESSGLKISVASLVNCVIRNSFSSVLEKFTAPPLKNTKDATYKALYPLRTPPSKVLNEEEKVEFIFDKTRELYSNLSYVNGKPFIYPCDITSFLCSTSYINFLNKKGKNSINFYSIVGMEICFGIVDKSVKDVLINVLKPYSIGTVANIFVFEEDNSLFRSYTATLCENAIRYTFSKNEFELLEIPITQKEKRRKNQK
jgi:hypothetical protein